jgi:predicted RNase H-like nuclease (RuvC/YqgF family)
MKNTVSRWVCCLTAAMILTGFMASAALADSDKDAKKETRHLQAQLSAAQKEKGVLATQLEDLKKQLGELGTKSAALEKKSGGQRKQLAEMTEKFQETDKNLQQMTQQYSDASKNLQQLQTEKERLSGEIQVCEKKNAELYRISVEMMDKYQSKGILSVLLQAEPFTQLERVKIQNLMQEYGDKAAAAKIVSTRAPASEPVNNTSASGVAESVPVAVPQTAGKDDPTSAVTSEAPVQTSNIAPAGDVAAGAPTSVPATPVDNNIQDAPRP